MSPSRDPFRILWGSPLPPTRSGVADYAVELLPELARSAEVRVLRPPDWDPPRDWPAEIEAVPNDSPPFDDETVVLHLGNNPHHLWVLDRLQRSGGVVVLHDAVLHHLLVESVGELADEADALEKALVKAHGFGAAALAAARSVGHHGRLDPFFFPGRKALLDRAAAVITHSEWAASAGVARKISP